MLLNRVTEYFLFLIDVILVFDIVLVIDIKVMEIYISDYFLIYSVFNFKFLKILFNYIKFRILKNYNVESFLLDL